MSNCYDILEDSSDSDSDAAKPAVDKKAQGAAKGPASVNNKDSSSDDSDSDSDEPATVQKAKSTVAKPAAKKVEEDSSRDENSYEEEEKAKTAVKPILK